MTIRDCIIKAAGYLGLKDIAADYEKRTQEDDEFLDMARDVVAEICSDYYPLRVTETVVADKDGNVMLRSLSKPVIDVFKMTANQTNLPFLIKYDRLEVGFAGEIKMEYSYMPDLSDPDAELPFGPRIDARVIAYGIAAEYALINAPEDAGLFDKRYKDALKKAIVQKSEKIVKKRTWL